MKPIHTVLLVGLFVVLSVIAFDLHRLATFVTGPLVAHSETRAERNDRLRRESAEQLEDWKAIWLDDGKPSKSAPASRGSGQATKK